MRYSTSWLLGLFTISFWLTSCGNDRIDEMRQLNSPDGRVVAIYRKYLYGGAAGGVGYCVIVSTEQELGKAKCALLASHVDGLEFAWHERYLDVSYKDATITSFSNKYYVAGVEGKLVPYEIRLFQRE